MPATIGASSPYWNGGTLTRKFFRATMMLGFLLRQAAIQIDC
jgi:hypothetical protein